jgi:transposase InsO family protein
MTNYLDIQETAQRLGCDIRHVRRLCSTGKLAGAAKKGSHWQIPITADARLARRANDGTSRQVDLLDIPADKRQEATDRLGVITEFEKVAAGCIRNGGTRTEALTRFTTEADIAIRSLERWIRKYRDLGLMGLVDSRGSKFTSQIISPDAFALFNSMYLTQQRLSVKTCWQNINYVNRSEKKNWNIPKLRAMYNLVEKIPLGVRVLHREGLAAYEAKCAPYIQIDPDSILPGQIWVGDHHQFNCWIRHRNDWIRPWITCWEDMRSRKIVGWHISAAPNQTTILLAMKRGIEKYGPPDSVKIDNGKDYDSEMWTGTTKVRRRILAKGYIDETRIAGIYAMLDIGVSFSIPYHPQSKPIERWFDTLDMQFTKTIPTYCGKDTIRRPDDLWDYLKSEKAILEAYTIDSFGELVSQYIEVYNNNAHTGSGMNGQTPNQVFSQRTSRRVLVDGVLELLMRTWSGELTVGKNGIRFKGMWYGQYNMDLAIWQGKKVVAAYDPDDMRRVYVYDSTNTKLITIAEQNQLISYGSAVSEESFREAQGQKSRAVRIARQFRDTRLAANMDLPTLTMKAMAEGQKQNDEHRISNTEVGAKTYSSIYAKATELGISKHRLYRIAYHRLKLNKPIQSLKELRLSDLNKLRGCLFGMQQRGTTIRPVATPLNNQVREHQRQVTIKALKRAAGAENLTAALDMDFSLLSTKKPESRKLGLFND